MYMTRAAISFLTNVYVLVSVGGKVPVSVRMFVFTLYHGMTV